jgi:hypothetical protein
MSRLFVPLSVGAPGSMSWLAGEPHRLGKIAARVGVTDGYVSRVADLAFLAPDVVEAMLNREQAAVKWRAFAYPNARRRTLPKHQLVALSKSARRCPPVRGPQREIGIDGRSNRGERGNGELVSSLAGTSPTRRRASRRCARRPTCDRHRQRR